MDFNGILDHPLLSAASQLAGEPLGWFNFTPRPDRPEAFDQQHSFCFNRDQVSFLIGGNAAGTTEAAAFKTSQFVLNQQPPPRRGTPFWIVANDLDQVCDVCWTEKLEGHGHIPACEVDWEGVTWHHVRANRPEQVPLKPWPVELAREVWLSSEHTKDKPLPPPDASWTLVFKSLEQGRRAMQARSIGGFWFSEQFPLDIFLEVLRGCREYMFPGGQFAEFTPIEPELCLWVEEVMERAATDPALKGWQFYRANTELNRPNLAVGWFESFFRTVSDEMLPTRLTGALATFEGVIYQSFNPHIHVLDDAAWKAIFPRGLPKGMRHFRGTDWGASEEHPHVTVWGAKDGKGEWWIYDEYWNNSQSAITADHIAEIQRRWKWAPNNPNYGPNFADPSRPGEINEFNHGGIPTQPAANDLYKGIDHVRSLLKVIEGQPRLHIHKRCKHLIDELRQYRWKKGRKPSGQILNPEVARPVPLKRNDDTVDALRYLLFTADLTAGAKIGSQDGSQKTGDRIGVQLDRAGVGKSGGQAWFRGK